MTAVDEALIKQVKSRLFPLSSAMSSMERLIECLPRIPVRVDLIANDDIIVIDASRGEYKAILSMPFFDMRVTPAFLKAGWYYLEAALVRNNGNRQASLRAEIRGEEKTCISIAIPTNLRGTVREVFYLPADVTKLRWSSTAAPGHFSQSRLLLHKISPLESILRRVSRVTFDLRRFRNRGPGANAGLSWWGAIRDLQDAYQRTATLRLQRLTGIDYPTFIALNDTLKAADVRAIRRRLARQRLSPVISLIMHIDSPVETLFKAALDAVSAQIYPGWELLLVGNPSENGKAMALIDEYRNKCVQIKFLRVESGATLASTLNSALERVNGQFVVTVKQDDRLAPHALYWLAEEISKYPDADLVYSDNDVMDDDGQRHDPHFKPDWNPDLLFSYNYLANPTLFRLTRVRQVGGYRSGFEGAEDYELLLRYVRDIHATNIRHVARVLCHTRTSDRPVSSIAPDVQEACCDKKTVCRSDILALQAYFKGSKVIVEAGLSPGTCRIRHPLPARPPLVSIIIPTRDRVEILGKCISGILHNTDYENWEILLVDNQSVEQETHAYFNLLKSDTRIRIVRYEDKFNYSALNNFAVQHARGEILALVNNDVEVISSGWLNEMVSHALRPEIGAVGAKLLYTNGTVQHAGVILGVGGVAGHAHRHLNGDDPGYCHRSVVTQNLSAVTGACMVVRKSIYRQVGGLNETDLAVAFNDIDFCLRLSAAGYRNVFTPYARLYHHESLSRGPDDTPEKRARYVRESDYMKKTWGGILQNDIAYNPNLTLEWESFSLCSNRQAVHRFAPGNFVRGLRTWCQQ